MLAARPAYSLLSPNLGAIVKASEIEVGGVYCAEINGKIVDVQVSGIRETNLGKCIHYDATDLSTGCRTTFTSAAEFHSMSHHGQSPKGAAEFEREQEALARLKKVEHQPCSQSYIAAKETYNLALEQLIEAR
jgi:hypothetical protein